MKKLIFALAMLTLLASSCTSNKAVVYVPANNSVEVAYPDYDDFRATLKNSSLTGVDVAVLSKETNKQIRGFGLGTKGNADVMVEAENKLVLKNNSNAPIYVKLKVTEESRDVFKKTGDYVSFTLKNTSAKPIPLLIPSVMNPNLSPFSESGVDLKIGQEILFRAKGKNYVLLTVDDSIAQGAKINVPELLTKRKKELGLK